MIKWETPKNTVSNFEIFDLSTGLFNDTDHFISRSLWEFVRDDHLDFSSGNHVIERINASCSDFDQDLFVCNAWFSDFCDVKSDIVFVISSVLCGFHCLLFSIFVVSDKDTSVVFLKLICMQISFVFVWHLYKDC